jgi:hypothetical protein
VNRSEFTVTGLNGLIAVTQQESVRRIVYLFNFL